MRPAVHFLLPLALSASPFAQGKVWVLDDEAGPDVDFTVLSTAVDAASDGDVLLLRSGEYDALDPLHPTVVLNIVGKSLVVTADRGARVVVRANQPALLPLLVQNLGPDQTVVLRGLEVVGRPVSAGFAPAAMAVVGAIEGSVRFEDCRLRSEQTELNQWGLLAQDCADLTLVRTSIEGSGYDVAAVQLFNTHAHFFETDVRGAHGAAAFIPEVHGGAAVVVEGGSLVASGGSFRGGDGGTPVDFGGSCFLETGGNGGHGLQVTSGQVYLSSVALAGGALGNGVAGCPDGAPGAALVDPGALVTVAAEPARGVRSASPAFAGRDTVLALVGQPGEDAFAVVAGAPDALLVPALGGALLVGPPAAVIPAGQVQPWGSTTVLVTVPPLPSGLEAATWHIQAAFLDPVLGTRLGGVTAVTVLAP